MDVDVAYADLKSRLCAYRVVKAIARELGRRADELEACRRFPALAEPIGQLELRTRAESRAPGRAGRAGGLEPVGTLPGGER